VIRLSRRDGDFDPEGIGIWLNPDRGLVGGSDRGERGSGELSRPVEVSASETESGIAPVDWAPPACCRILVTRGVD
jgi:hypothetical protein